MTDAIHREDQILQELSRVLPPDFEIHGEVLSFHGGSVGSIYVSSEPGRFEVELEPFFDWDHGYSGTIPHAVVERFEGARASYMTRWQALGGELRGELWFRHCPGHFLQKIGWVDLTAEGVRDLLWKAQEVGFGFQFAEPDRVTVANLQARFEDHVFVEHPPEDGDALHLFHNGEEIAAWSSDLQRLFVRLPLFLAPFDATLPQPAIEALGKSLEQRLTEALPEGFTLEDLDCEEGPDGPWWSAFLGFDCTTIAQLEEALRVVADHATAIRPGFPKSLLAPGLGAFLTAITTVQPPDAARPAD